MASTLDNSPILIIAKDTNWNLPSTRLYDFTFKNQKNKNNKETSRAFARYQPEVGSYTNQLRQDISLPGAPT